MDRETLWKIMRHYGIPSKIVELTKEMYDGTSCKVIHDGMLSESFKIKTADLPFIPIFSVFTDFSDLFSKNTKIQITYLKIPNF